jgi:outer membrane protein OmpA-like peptidoglycan-associated protein
VRRAEEARLQAEREAAAKRQQDAEEAAAESARRRAAAEEQQRLEAERRAQAERDAEQSRLRSLESQLAAERAARERAEASAEAERARQAAQQAEQERLRLIEEQRVARERLRQQLNQILETRETARGLIVNMSDVLFEFGKWSLKPGAKLKLAKVAGILLAHPSLTLQIEGHTDNIGSDEYNQKLSQRRADTVKEFLVAQGVAEANVTTTGFGETQPVAANTNAAGRQQNRRVEVVVSGEEIGVQRTQASPQ